MSLLKIPTLNHQLLITLLLLMHLIVKMWLGLVREMKVKVFQSMIVKFKIQIKLLFYTRRLGWLVIRTTLDPDLPDVRPALRQEPPVCFHTVQNGTISSLNVFRGIFLNTFFLILIICSSKRNVINKHQLFRF